MKNIILQLTLTLALFSFSQALLAKGGGVGSPPSDSMVQVPTAVALFIDDYQVSSNYDYRYGKLDRPLRIASYNEFLAYFRPDVHIAQFYANTDGTIVVMKSADLLTGLEDVRSSGEFFNILVMPMLYQIEESQARLIRAKALELVNEQNAFVIFDTPANLNYEQTLTWRDNASELMGQSRAALYYPHLKLTNGQTVGASSTMAGLYSYTDSYLGVWSTPANISPQNVLSLTDSINNTRYDELSSASNGVAINAIRNFHGQGPVVWGARSLDSLGQLRYVPLQRLVSMVQLTLESGLKVYSSIPASPQLWPVFKSVISAYLARLYKQGGLWGPTADQAFEVICDESNNSATDIRNGVVNVHVKLNLLNQVYSYDFQVQVAK
jgi:hypothetical protein